MAELKVGDSVLFFGKALNVTAIEDNANGQKVAVIRDAAAVKARDEARAKILALREEQATLKGENHDLVAQKIAALDDAAMQALFTLKLRVDLLKYWGERGLWVSDGRILSDDQRDVFVKLMGRKPLPDGERMAVAFVEGLGEDKFKEVLAQVRA